MKKISTRTICCFQRVDIIYRRRSSREKKNNISDQLRWNIKSPFKKCRLMKNKRKWNTRKRKNIIPFLNRKKHQFAFTVRYYYFFFVIFIQLIVASCKLRAVSSFFFSIQIADICFCYLFVHNMTLSYFVCENFPLGLNTNDVNVTLFTFFFLLLFPFLLFFIRTLHIFSASYEMYGISSSWMVFNKANTWA